MSSCHITVPVTRFAAGTAEPATPDAVVVEEPLEIRVEGRPVAVTMRTPGHDEDLAVGFLLTEGVIVAASDLLEVNCCPSTSGAAGNVVDVLLRRPSAVDFERLTRHVFSSSSCGLCGKATLEAVQARCPPLPKRGPVSAASLLRLPDQLSAAQVTFQRTGGLHAAALFDEAGHLLIVREDVGRHNAVDKVIGHSLRQVRANERDVGASRVAAPVGLVVSGRVSFEIVQKAAMAGLGVVAAVSAPSSLAVDFSRAQGQTLIGFLREGRLNVYAGTVMP